MRKAPVKHTCPDIDKLIKLLEDFEKSYKDHEDSDLKYSIYNLVWEVSNGLEDLRKSNSLLRDWGEDLCTEIDSLENYTSELESKINQTT